MRNPLLPVLWGLGALLTVWLVIIAPHSLVERDFSNLWVAGRLAMDGRIAEIFDVESFRRASHAMLGMTSLNNYSYPPHALFLAVPFGLVSQPVAFWLWNIASGLFFTWAARKHLPEGFPVYLAAFTPAALACYWFGHYGLLIGGLWFLAFSGSGVSAALLTIKPHLGLLVAVQMLRDRKALAVAIITTAALVILSAAAFGIDAWRAFFTATFDYQVGLLKPGAMRVMNLTSVSPVLAYGVTGWACFALAATYLVRRNFNVWTAATATFLIVPYGFHYDMTVACLGFGVLAATKEMRAWERAIIILAFMTPELIIFGSKLAPPLLLAGLWVQVRLYNSSSQAASKSGWSASSSLSMSRRHSSPAT